MKQSRYIVTLIILVLVMVIMIMVRARILMGGQILPLDHFLNQFDIIFVNLGSAIHQHHDIVVGGSVVSGGLRHVCW